MTEDRWFIPELDDPADITPDERSFAAALSEATAHLVSANADVGDLLMPAEYADLGRPAMVAGLSITDRIAGNRLRELVPFGVHFAGHRVTGGRRARSMRADTSSPTLTRRSASPIPGRPRRPASTSR